MHDAAFRRGSRSSRPSLIELVFGCVRSPAHQMSHRLSGTEGTWPRFTGRAEVMKLGDVVMTKITIQPNVVEKERSKSTPTPVEIRLRAFEIHIERGGIHHLALDTWQQTEANFKKSPKTTKEKQQRNEKRDRDDVESRERGATVKSPSLF